MRAGEQMHFILHIPFLFEHIESRAGEYAVLERFDQSRGLNHRSARGVDKIRAFFYLADVAEVYKMVRLLHIRDMEGYNIACAEQLRQLRVRKSYLFCKSIIFKSIRHKHLHAEAFGYARGMLAYFAATDHADCFAGQVKSGKTFL